MTESFAELFEQSQTQLAKLKNGAIITGTAVDELHRTGGRYALITLCVAAGMGVATIIEDGESSAGGRVELGSVIVLANETTKKDMKVQVVSAPEAAVLGGSLPRISEDSPVGKELAGRKKGEAFVVNLDNGKQVKYKVKSIEY